MISSENHQDFSGYLTFFLEQTVIFCIQFEFLKKNLILQEKTTFWQLLLKKGIPKGCVISKLNSPTELTFEQFLKIIIKFVMKHANVQLRCRK
jgi:hypothetical protein